MCSDIPLSNPDNGTRRIAMDNAESLCHIFAATGAPVQRMLRNLAASPVRREP
jgi:hypothetical protein